MKFKVRLIFAISLTSGDIIVSGANENDVIEKIGNMIKNKEIFFQNEGVGSATLTWHK